MPKSNEKKKKNISKIKTRKINEFVQAIIRWSNREKQRIMGRIGKRRFA